MERIFPDNRLEGANELERGHLVLARMYKIFVFLCNKYNIEWWTAGGTTLAAIRTQQIMPWSGDLDVCITDDSFIKFKKYCVQELPKSIFFQTDETDPYFTQKNKCYLRDKYSNYYEWADQNKNSRHHNGLQIDIFIFSEDVCLCSSLGKWKRKDTFPLIRKKFLGTDCFLPKNYKKICKILYGENYMSKTLKNHSGKWHSTKPCDHRESLAWEQQTDDKAGTRQVFSH